MQQQQQQQQPEPSPVERFRSAANWLYLISKAVAVTAEVAFLRRGFGNRYLGVHAFLAIPLMLIYALGWPGRELRPLLAYLALYVLMCLAARVDMVTRRRQSRRGHSRYDGFPRLARFFPRLSELTIKRAVEPLAVVLLSVPVTWLNEPLGRYLLLCSIALFITVNITAAFDRVRSMDIHDAFIDQQEAAEHVRRTRGEHH